MLCISKGWCRNSFLFVFMIVLQLLIIIYFGEQKEGLFVDEIWSFNLANHYYHPFLKSASDYFNRWLCQDDWVRTLAVSIEHRFNYDSIIYNLSQDVHPPLFFIALHTVCSFFPEQFSRWHGYALNMSFFVLTQVFLSLFIYEVTRDKTKALLVCMFYGFNWGVINTVLYIRAYMLMTLFGIASFYFHSILLETKIKNNTVLLISIYLITVCGLLTHYYFLIFGFYLSIGYIGLNIIKKTYKGLIIYTGAMTGAAISSILFFKPLLLQFAGKTSQGWHVKRAVGNLFQTSFIERFGLFFDYLNSEIFGGLLIFGSLLLVLVVVTKVFVRKELSFSHDFQGFTIRLKQWLIQMVDLSDWQISIYILLIFTAFFYFSTIAKISPFDEDHAIRYFFVLYPFIASLFVLVFLSILKLFCNNTRFILIVFLLTTVLLFVKSYGTKSLTIMDHSYAGIVRQISIEKTNIAIIAINRNTRWYPLIKKVQLMTNAPKAYLIEEKNINNLKIILKDYSKNHNSILIYRAENCKIPIRKMLNYIKTKTGYRLKKDLGGDVYLLKK